MQRRFVFLKQRPSLALSDDDVAAGVFRSDSAPLPSILNSNPPPLFHQLSRGGHESPVRQKDSDFLPVTPPPLARIESARPVGRSLEFALENATDDPPPSKEARDVEVRFGFLLEGAARDGGGV
jgi:hypothetical protein